MARPWQPQEIAASVAESRHVWTHRINKFRAFTRELSNLTTSRRPVNRGEANTKMASIGPRNVDVKSLDRRSNPPDNLARPQTVAQNGYPTIFRLADRAKCVARIGLLIGVQAALRKVAFPRSIGGLRCVSRADAEGFSLETLEALPQLFDARRGHSDAALRSFPPIEFVRSTELSNAIQVAEEIHGKRFLGRQSRKDLSPNLRAFISTHWLAVLGFDQFHPHGLHFVAEVQRLHVQGIGRQLEGAAAHSRGAHSSSSA